MFCDTSVTVIKNVDPGDGHGPFDIVYVPDGDYVDRMCRRLGTKNDDDGQPVGQREIRGCYDYDKKIMYLSSPESFRHEMNHRANPPKWDGKQWVYKK